MGHIRPAEEALPQGLESVLLERDLDGVHDPVELVRRGVWAAVCGCAGRGQTTAIVEEHACGGDGWRTAAAAAGGNTSLRLRGLVGGVPDARAVRLKPGAVSLSGCLMLSAYGLDPWAVLVVHLWFRLDPWPGGVGLLWCVRAELAVWEDTRSELAKWKLTERMESPGGSGTAALW